MTFNAVFPNCAMISSSPGYILPFSALAASSFGVMLAIFDWPGAPFITPNHRSERSAFELGKDIFRAADPWTPTFLHEHFWRLQRGYKRFSALWTAVKPFTILVKSTGHLHLPSLQGHTYFGQILLYFHMLNYLCLSIFAICSLLGSELQVNCHCPLRGQKICCKGHTALLLLPVAAYTIF